jgi:hypothetical protein
MISKLIKDHKVVKEFAGRTVFPEVRVPLVQLRGRLIVEWGPEDMALPEDMPVMDIYRFDHCVGDICYYSFKETA